MRGAPPAYDTPEYWEARFAADLAAGSHFEWLGNGADTLLPPCVRHLSTLVPLAPPSADNTYSQPPPPPPAVARHEPIRCLNIGCGSSALHVRAGAVWDQAGLPRHDFWNLDYAASAIRAAQQLEPPGQESMRYVVGDLLDWQALTRQLLQALPQASLPSPPAQKPEQTSEEKEKPVECALFRPRTDPPVLFDIILDKSTSDAIATGPDVVFGQAEDSEEMLAMLQRAMASSSSSSLPQKDKRDGAGNSSTAGNSTATVEPCCPLFPPEWYALRIPGSDSSFQQYLDTHAARSQSDPDSSVHSIPLSSHLNSNSKSNSSLGEKKRSIHLPRPCPDEEDDSGRQTMPVASDTGLAVSSNADNTSERESSSPAISSESAESIPTQGARGPNPAASGESAGSGNSNTTSNSNPISLSSSSSQMVHRVDPLVVLATHLAALVRPGGVWLIMSYSSDRCRFLQRPLRSPYHAPSARGLAHPPAESDARTDKPATAHGELHHPTDFWTLEETKAIPVPSGTGPSGTGPSGTGSAPPIFHYCYVLRRLPHPT